MFGAPQPTRERSRSPARGQGEIITDAATFLKDHIIDDTVLYRFLSLTPDQQLLVMARGSLSGARDASAVLSSRISQLQGAIPQMNAVAQPSLADPMVAQANLADPMVQLQMMQMMGQIPGQIPGQVPGQVPGQAAGGKGGKRSEDWYCQACGDHQFAKNALCRNCGAARPTDGSEYIPPTPEKFLAMHPGLGENAVASFRALDPEGQAAIIKRGSLMSARDPTAVLIGRIKTLRDQAAGRSGGKGAPVTQQGVDQSMQMMQQMMMQMMQMMMQQQQLAQQQQPQQQPQLQLSGMQQTQLQQPMSAMQQAQLQLGQPQAEYGGMQQQ